MATNYTFSQVCEIINEGKNTEALIDIGRRYPLLMCAVSKVTAVAGDSFVELMSYLPDHLTANKVYTAMKSGANNDAASDDTDDDDTTATEKEAEEPKANKKATKESSNDAGEKDYKSMSGKELWELLGKADKRKDCKEKMGGTNKKQMVEYITKYGLGADPATEAEESAEEAEAEVEEAKENPYDGMSAMELFKECKKRGIKAEPKQKAKVYAMMLMKDDAAAANDNANDSGDDDGWGDDDAEEETPKKATKAPKEKNAKAKKAAKEEDDDDDWEI